MCFPFSPGKRETHKQIDPRPFPGRSREFVDVYWFFSPPIFFGKSPRALTGQPDVQTVAIWAPVGHLQGSFGQLSANSQLVTHETSHSP